MHPELKHSPTSGVSLLSALAFANAVFNLTGCADAMASQRVKGRARQLALQKHPKRQAVPLSVHAVMSLERLTRTPPRIQDIVHCAFLLFMLHASFGDVVTC
eukprot:3359672-Amphidinium_carterae.2